MDLEAGDGFERVDLPHQEAAAGIGVEPDQEGADQDEQRQQDDAGQVYVSQTPQLSALRFGVGVGGRLYTNFGPVRLDVATPIDRRPGEARISIYVSIGQAF